MGFFSVAGAATAENLQKAQKLNDTAIVKMKEGNLNGAELDLLSALEYSGQNPKLKKNLGVVYYEKGVRATKSGNFFEAEKYLKSALETDADDERYQHAYGTALFVEAERRAKAGRIEEALDLYGKAAGTNEKNIHLWTQAAYFSWKAQRMELAAKYVDRARALDPDDKDVRMLGEKLQKSSAEPETGFEQSEHFILSGDEKSMTGGYPVLVDLEQAYNEVSYQLNFFPKNKITVVFYPVNEFHEHWKLPSRVNGFYDGKLRIPYTGDQAHFESMKPMIKHELTHAFVNAMTRQSIPQWLNEGLAQWVEGKQLEPKSKDALVIYQITGRVPDITHLDEALKSQKNPYNNTEMTLAYMKSLSLTQYLIESYGLWSVVQFIQGRDSGTPKEILFKKYWQADAKEIEEGWTHWLEKQKSNFIH